MDDNNSSDLVEEENGNVEESEEVSLLRAQVSALTTKVHDLENSLANAGNGDDGSLDNQDNKNNMNGDVLENTDRTRRRSISTPIFTSFLGHKRRYLSKDTFSFLLFARPCSTPFYTAMCVFLIQMLTFTLVAVSIIDMNNTDNPLDIPGNVEFPVRITQLVAILVAVFTQEDIRTALNLAYERYRDEQFQGFEGATFVKWLCAVGLRFMEGALGLIVTCFLVVTEEDVVELLLNFTAMEFVSRLDEAVFFLSDNGLFGKKNESSVEKVLTTEYTVYTKSGRKTRLCSLLVILFSMLLGFGMVIRNQQSGSYLCNSVYVQFSDDLKPALGTFSGVYDLDVGKTFLLPEYATYIERRSQKAKLGYCSKLESWTLSFDDRGAGAADPCDWHAKSSKTVSFDLTMTSSLEWSARQNSREVPLQFFHLACYDCDNGDDTPCSGRGSCIKNTCQCDDGFYGLQCEFDDPCNTLAIDEQFSGFLGTRDWSTKYDLLRHENQIVDVYDHPVYVNEYEEGLFDVILFTGRRWVATYSDFLSLNKNATTSNKDTKTNLHEYLIQFHAHFSDYQVAFISDSVDKDTPNDAATPLSIEWFHAESKKPEMGIQTADSNRALDAIFLCYVCDDATNPCRYDGTCVDGSCMCSTGSSGVLCQLPPIGNGRCDVFFNSAQFNYDGGDCCESTCKSGPQYTCGKDATGLIELGYSSCHEPPNTWIENSNPILSQNGRFARLGKSVALSENGSVLAISEPGSGRVYLFDRDGSEWIIRGRALEGPPGSNYGDQITLSGGLKNAVRNPFAAIPITLIVGTSDYSNRGTGVTRTFDIYDCMTQGCQKQLELEGRAIAISKNGKTVALSEVGYEGGVIIYDYIDSELATARFVPINRGRELAVFFSPPTARYISMSENGNFIAIGTVGFEGQDDTALGNRITYASLTVQVYTSDPDPFSLGLVSHGSPIYTASHLFGPTQESFPEQSVVLSDDAMVLAISSKYDTEISQRSGVQIYHWDGNHWTPKGGLLLNSVEDEPMSIDLSSDGSIVALGTGVSVQVLKWNDDISDYIQLGSELSGGTPNSLSLSEDGLVVAVGLPISENKEGGTTSVYKFSSSELKCAEGMMLFQFFLTTDSNGHETRWNLISRTSGIVLLEGGPYGNAAFTTFTEEICLDVNDCSVFTMYDDGIDGNLNTPGRYDIFLDGEPVANEKNLQKLNQHKFGNCPSCPEGTSNIQIVMHSTQQLESVYWALRDSSGTRLEEGGPYPEQTVVEEFCVPNINDDCAIFTVTGGNTDSCAVIGFPPKLKYFIYKDGEVVSSGEPFLSCSGRSQIGGCAKTTPISCDDGTVPIDMTVDLPDGTPLEGIRWIIESSCSGELLLSGGPYDQFDFGLTYNEKACIPIDACPMLVFDGIATYTIHLDGVKVMSNIGDQEPTLVINEIKDACICADTVCEEDSTRVSIGVWETFETAIGSELSVTSCTGESLLEVRPSNSTDLDMTIRTYEVCIPVEDCASLTFLGTANFYVMMDGEMTYADLSSGIEGEERGLVHGLRDCFCLPSFVP